MDSHQSPPASATPGTLHFIPPNLCAFEPNKLSTSTGGHPVAPNTVLWIGGMYDTLRSISYPFQLAQALPPTWKLLTCALSSAGVAWGVGSIAQDAAEIGAIVAYIRNHTATTTADAPKGGRVVIMGHSTGCQDCMEYVVGNGAETRGPVDGVVLQAPVSDREAIGTVIGAEEIREADETAEAWCRDGRGEDVLARRLVKGIFPQVPVTARRWVDVSSPGPAHAGADDYFSSDLPVERLRTTFGKLPARTALLILEGGNDEGIPASVDKQKLIDTWSEVVKSAGGSVDEVNSGVIPGASHNLNNQSSEIVQDLVGRVVRFVERLDRGDFGPETTART